MSRSSKHVYTSLNPYLKQIYIHDSGELDIKSFHDDRCRVEVPVDLLEKAHALAVQLATRTMYGTVLVEYYNQDWFVGYGSSENSSYWMRSDNGKWIARATVGE